MRLVKTRIDDFNTAPARLSKEICAARQPVSSIRIGCAGWALRKEHFELFPKEGTHLTTYAARMSAVEINSSFYRTHLPNTYTRWAESVPDSFLFAVKMPKQVTHVQRLAYVEDALDRFLSEVSSLDGKLGPVLVQLPPSLSFSFTIAERFFTCLRERFDGEVALEPRHVSWFADKADRLITSFRIARVAADPAVVAAASEPGGWGELAYYRLHGAPRTYYSSYSEDYLGALAQKLIEESSAASVWCIFDNTAEGAATLNALEVRKRV